MKKCQKEEKSDNTPSKDYCASFFHCPQFYKYVPNTLTTLRLLGTPVILWGIIEDQFIAAFWLFIFVCLTDWLDGYLARKWQVISKFGQIADPLADKFLLICVYLTLTLKGLVPLWLTVCIILRDVFILIVSSGIIISYKKNISLAPHLIGKISTMLQMTFIGLVLIAGRPVFPSISLSSVEGVLMVSFLYSVAFITVLSGIIYAWIALAIFRKP